MTRSQAESVPEPDNIARGFLTEYADPLRYDGQPNDADEVVGVLSSMIPQSARVLDVGCGTGSVSVHLMANTGAQIVGVEPDPRRAALARQRGLDVRAELLTEGLVSRIGLFDVVLFADVLEHLADPFSLLSIAKRALGPGGAIVASVPNTAHWSVRADLFRGRFEYRKWGIMDATHLRWFTSSSLRFLFTSAELSVLTERVTVGIDLDCYSERFPWRRMSRETRASLIRRGVRYWPRLFGCQLVVKAVPAERGIRS